MTSVLHKFTLCFHADGNFGYSEEQRRCYDSTAVSACSDAENNETPDFVA